MPFCVKTLRRFFFTLVFLTVPVIRHLNRSCLQICRFSPVLGAGLEQFYLPGVTGLGCRV
jgi:hypothetical protein